MPSAVRVLFFWAIYGIAPAMAGYGVLVGRGRRHVPLIGLALVLGVLGLGGTTPLPDLLHGRQWEWLTYDRFSLWCAVALLPMAGLGVRRLLRRGSGLGKAAISVCVLVLAAWATIDAFLALLGPSLPYQQDVRPSADFLNGEGRARRRYLTFGFGDTVVRLSYLTEATTIDGAYFSARRLPELAESGIGMVDYALWWDPTGRALRRVLAQANQRSIRWAFTHESGYAPYLREAGFEPIGDLAGGTSVWENPLAPPLPDTPAKPPVEPMGILWGTLPMACLAVAGALGVSQRLRGSAASGWGARGGRDGRRSGPPRDAVSEHGVHESAQASNIRPRRSTAASRPGAPEARVTA